MASSFINVNSAGPTGDTQMQTYLNSVGGTNVHSEAVTLADKTGTNIGTTGDALNVYLGTINIGTMPNVNVSSSVTLGANSSFNLSQVGGSTVSTAATGTLRVGIVGNLGATIDSTAAAGTAPTNGVLTVGQYKATAPAPSDTQTIATQVDQAGNNRITYGGNATTLSTWNSGTALNSTQTLFSNSGITGVTVFLQVSAGTFATGAITFEGSFDGTNWATVPTSAVLDPTDATFATIAVPYTLLSNTNKAFLIISAGWQALRIKLSTVISGTGTVVPIVNLLPEVPSRPVTLSAGGAGNKIDISKVGGNTTVTSATGVLKVGISGQSAATLDGLITGGSAPANGLGILGISEGGGVGAAKATTALQGAGLAMSGGNQLLTEPGSYAGYGVITTWTSATSLNQTQNIFTTAYGPAMISVELNTTSTITAGAITFEVSYDFNQGVPTWITMPADCILDPTSTSLSAIAVPYTLVANTQKQFILINRGFQGVRIRLSTQITGTGSLTILPVLHSISNYQWTDAKSIKGSTISTQASGVQDTALRHVDGSTALAEKWFTQRINTQANTFPTNSTAYIECVKIFVASGTAGSALTLRDQSGSGNITFLSLTNLANVPQGNYLESYVGTLKMTGGMNINTTGGGSPSDLNIAIKYWQ